MRVNCLKFEKFARLSRPYPSSKPNEATTKRHCTRDFLSLDDFSFNDTLLFFKLRQLILVCNLSLLTQIPLFANSKINRLKTSMRKYLNFFSTCYFIAGRGRDSFIAIMRQQEHVLLIHQPRHQVRMQFTQFGELCIKPNACLELQNFVRVSACVQSKLDCLQLSTID